MGEVDVKGQQILLIRETYTQEVTRMPMHYEAMTSIIGQPVVAFVATMPLTNE